MNNDNIFSCEKCNEMFPKIIFTCPECCKEAGWARGYNMTNPARILCFECFNNLREKAWKYDNLCE